MYVSPSAPPMSRPPLTTGARIIISLRAALCFSPMHTLPRPLQSGTFPILNPKKRRSRMLSEITEQLRDQAAIEWRSDSSSIWKLIGIKQFVGLGIQLGPCLWAASNKQGKGKTKSYPCKWNRVIADLMSHGHWTHECLHLRLHRVWACPLPAERWEPLSGVPEETSGPQERPAHRARMLPRRTQQKSQINASPFSGHWTINRRQLWWLGWWDYLPRRDVHTASTTMLRKWKRKIGLWWKGRRLRQRKFTNLICYLRKVEKEKQNKPRVSKRREIRGETNETIHNGENEHWEERALREGKYNAKLCQQRALEGLQGSERKGLLSWCRSWALPSPGCRGPGGAHLRGGALLASKQLRTPALAPASQGSAVSWATAPTPLQRWIPALQGGEQTSKLVPSWDIFLRS